MQKPHKNIIDHLCLKYPPEVIHEISSKEIYIELVRRMGEEALELSPEDLELAGEEVKAAIEHHLDERDFIEIGLDAWELVRNL